MKANKEPRKLNKKTVIRILAAVLAAIVIVAAGIFVLPKTPGEIQSIDANTTYDTISLKWSEAENAQGYRVYCKKPGKKDFELFTKTSKCSYKSKNVRTGREYTYKIVPYNMFKESEPCEYTVSTSIGNPKITVEVGTGSIKVSSTEVPGATGYEFYRDDTLVMRQASPQIEDTNIEPDKKYVYSVRAYRYDVNSVYSDADSHGAKIVSLGDFNAKLDENNIIDLSWETKEEYKEYDIYKDDKKIATVETGEYKDENTDDEEHEYKVIGKSESRTSPAIVKRLQRTKRESTNKEAIQGALDWGAKIAADNSYGYGPGTRGHWKGTPKCYICGTIKEKRWTCMPFVGACYAHGAKDADILSGGSHMIYTTDHNFTKYSCWKKVGLCKDLTIDDLEPGDVIIRWSTSQGGNRKSDPGHACIYYGDDRILESTGVKSFNDQIRVTSGGAAKRLANYGSDNSKDPASGKKKKELNYVMRYIGQGGGTSYELQELD